MEITVRLEPLRGTRQTQFGPVEVEHDVYTIIGNVTADGGRRHFVELGQVGKKPGSPITFRRDSHGQQFPDSFKDAAKREIARVHGEEAGKVSEQPEYATAEAVTDYDDDTILDDE